MEELIYQLSLQSPNIGMKDIIVNLATATLLSVAIYISYWFTHNGSAYSRRFNISLVTLAILTSTVMTVIGSNIALSLGMVGALSIVRFRTAIKDSRDTTYIFWSIIIGIASGAGAHLVAILGSIVVFIVLLLFGRVTNNHRLLLIIKSDKLNEKEIESIVFNHFKKKALLKVKNTTEESVEWIYEISRSTYDNHSVEGQTIIDRIYENNGVNYVNIVAQNDEVNG